MYPCFLHEKEPLDAALRLSISAFFDSLRCVSVDDALRDVALGAAAVHGLLFYVAVRLRLGHSAALDEQAFRPVDEADVLDALLEAAVFVCLLYTSDAADD